MFNIAVKIAILSTFPIHYLIPTYMFNYVDARTRTWSSEYCTKIGWSVGRIRIQASKFIKQKFSCLFNNSLVPRTSTFKNLLGFWQQVIAIHLFYCKMANSKTIILNPASVQIAFKIIFHIATFLNQKFDMDHTGRSKPRRKGGELKKWSDKHIGAWKASILATSLPPPGIVST